jgi:hypothetical protein
VTPCRVELYGLLVRWGVVFILALCATVRSQAQGYSQGQPIVGSQTNTLVSSPMYLDATQFSGSARIPAGEGCGTGTTVPLSNDAAGQIQAAICAVADGGTVDARGFAGTSPTLQSNPFADPVNTDGHGTDVTTKTLTLLLPEGTISVYVPIGMSKQTSMFGQGSYTTTLQMVSTFPGYNSGTSSEVSGNCGSGGNPCFPLICMGVGGGVIGSNPPMTSTTNAPFIWNSTYSGNSCETPNSFLYGVGANGTSCTGCISNNPRIKIGGFRLLVNPSGAAPTAYGVGIANITAEEKSTVTNVTVNGWGNGGRAINIANTGTQSHQYANNMQNSGPYTDLELNWSLPGGADCSTFTVPTYGIFVSNGPSVTVGEGGHITFNGGACASTGIPYTNLIGIDASGAGVKIGGTIHCENYYDCVRLGSDNAVIGGSVDNITAAGNTQNDVEIGASHHVLAAISHLYGYNTGTGANIVNCVLDNQAGVTVSSGTLSGGGCNHYSAGLSTDPTSYSAEPVDFLGGVASAPTGVVVNALKANNPIGTSVDIADFQVNGSTLASVSNKGRISASRHNVDAATTIVAGDFAFTSGWGVSPSITITNANSKDQAFTVTVTAGTIPSPSPVLTLTFQDGTWTQIPVYTCNMNPGSTATLQLLIVNASATTLAITYNGTPASGQTVAMSCVGMGT